MVNIVSIVSIDDDTIQTYPGFDSWWQVVHGMATEKQRNDQIEYKRRRDNFSASLGAKYHIPLQRLENVGFLFANLTQLKQEFTDYETRTIICNLQAKVIIQNKMSNGQLTVTTIVHDGQTFKTFITSAPLGSPILKTQKIEEE